MSATSSNSEYGAGIGIYQAKQLKILGGLIQNNGRQEAADSTAMRYLGGNGGGIYAEVQSNYQRPEEITIQNITIQRNKAGSGGGIFYYDTSYHHKALFKNIKVDSNIAKYNGGGIYTSSGDAVIVTLGLEDVQVTNNRALGVSSYSSDNYASNAYGGGIYGGFTWAKNLIVRGNSAETAYVSKYSANGGGIYLNNFSTKSYSGTTYYAKDIVMENCTIEDNTAQGMGGGIFNNSVASDSKSNRFGLTLTGTTRVTNNTAKGPKGMGGGIYNNNSPLTLNAAVEWINTAEGISDNTNGTPAGSNIYTNTSDEVRLLQGTFVGNTSIVGYRSDTTVGKIVLDPTKVNFQPEENGYAIHSENPRTQIVLLQPLPTDKTLPVSINHKNFQPGSLLVVPANVTEISTSALKDNANAEVGEVEVDNTLKITYQNACKDASVNSSSISVSAQPSRAQFAPVPDTKDTTLTNMGFVGEGVYLDGENGDDSNSGLSPAAAVKTFDVAKQRLQTYAAEENRADGFRPVIWVCGTVTISGDTEMTLAQADVDAAGLQRYIDAEKRDNRTPDKVSVQRYAPMNDRPMFKVTDGTLTLKNIKLNGNAESVTAPGSSVIAPIVMLSGSNVNLNIQDGARLYNNLSTALVYVTNAKSITVNQTYATTERDTVNDEWYGAQLDASQNKNGTVCSYLIYGKDLPQVVDITLSGTAWLNMAGTYFSGSYRSDAQGIYINSGAGANVTLKDNAKISGITSSNGSRQYAVYIGSPTKKVAFLMQGAAEIQYVRYGLYLSNPRQGCTIEMRDTAEVQYVNSGLYLYGPYGNSTISLKNNANIKYATDSSGRVIGFYNNNSVTDTMGTDQTITLQDDSSLQGGGINGIIGSELAAGTTGTPRIGTVQIKDNAYVTSSYTTTMANAKYPVIQAQKVVLNNSKPIPARVKDTSARDQWGCNVSIEADDLQLCGDAEIEGAILLTGKLDPNKNPTPITLTSAIPDGTAESKFRLQLRDTFMGLPVVQGNGIIPIMNVADASQYLKYFAMSVGLGDAGKMSLIANTANKTIDLSRPMNVYLSTNGDDAYDGSSPARAVRTFKRAKALLQNGEGYGEGSDIIVPDTVSVQSGDTEWSFDEGGTLTNSKTKETWAPKVRRNSDGLYTYPMVSVNMTANFHDITLDGGGNEVSFNTTMQNCGFSLLYISGGTVTLGQNTVLTNVDYTQPSGTYFANKSRGGGFALTVSGSSTKAIMNGAVIENIKVNSYQRNSDAWNEYDYYYNATYADVSIVSVRNAATLEMNSGAVRNNELQTSYNYSVYSSQNSQAIISVMAANFTLNGGEIEGNKLNSGYSNSYILKGIITVTGNSYYSSNYSTFLMSGGDVSGNTSLGSYSSTVAVGNHYTNYYRNDYNRSEDTRNSKNNFRMLGGTIRDNRSNSYPAMYIDYGYATMVGGMVYGNVLVDSNNNEVAADKISRSQQPIYVNSYKNVSRLILEGGGCQIDDGIYTSSYPIIVSKPIRNTKRVYTVYPSRTNMGAVVVQPDGASLVSVAPYAGNFDIRVNGRVASAGKTAINVSSEVHTTSTMTEDNCIVLYKPVFVNGETGKDPTSINMNTGAVTAASGVNTTDLGRRPDNPVKTLDAAILIGQAPDSVEGGSWGSQHNTYLNYYIVYATGSVHNELYKGNYTLPTSGYYTAGKIKVPNKVADDITYSMDTPAYMARYTGFDVITNSGETVKGESQYNYDHLLDLTNSGKVALQNIEIYGRRLTDGTDKAGEALVRISDGVTLKMLDNTVLANNFANGNRPAGEDLTPLPMTMKGGAVRIEAGGTLTMAGGRINNTQAVYGNAIYVDEAANKVGTVMLQNKPQIDGSIYLVGNKTVVNADKSYLPASGVNIALQHDYSGREVAVMTDGTKIDSEHQKLFGLTDSIRALYEVKPKEDEPHKLLLFLKSVYYIDPNISDAVANRDGMTADTAFKTLDELYDVLRGQQDLNGVMVYVVNPITVEKGKTVKLINASKTSGVVRKYYSLYTNILGETKKTETQVYFKRYVQPKLSEGGTVPTGFTAASNKSMIFDVQGTLTLKGIYLDGYSRELEDAQKNWTEEALVAEAPLVRVEAGGSLICDARGETIDNINMEVAATIFTNSTNNKAKTQLLPTAPGIVEGCSAGLEILSDATAEGSATLQKAEFTNLVLDNSKETFVGGAAIYVNGKLIAGEQTFIEDTVYLEGQGKAGTDAETVKLQQTSRYITISKQGTPFSAAFTVLMRDAYNGRLVVRYPAAAADVTIPDDNLSKYLLSDEVSRFYLLKEKRTSVNSVNYQDLCLYAPDAVYIDPVNGNDNNEGFRPTQAVKTLVKAFNQIKASSGKVLYIMNEVPITTSVSLTHEDFVYSSTKITMPNTKHLMIRRYAKPDTKDSAYNKPDYLGSLFAVENGGELVLSGNVEVDGLCEGTIGDHIPEGQVVKTGIASKAALIRVDNGGQLYVGMNEDTGKPVTLKNNDNTATLSGVETANYGGALEIQEGGTVIMNGGAIDGNRSRVVPKTALSEQPGYANAIYSNGGTLIVARNPGGIAESEHPTDFICLDNGATITMQMLLNDDEATKNLKYSVSVMDPEVGRDVVKYDGYTDVDAEHVHYTLDGTVPKSLFLVQAANQSNVLELQDWKFLNVEVPEEVFLGIHQTKSTAGADGNIPTAVRRVDVDGTQYADPEYTVTNKGAYEARVTVTSFTKQDTKNNITVPLVAAKADLNNKTDPKLYLALTKSSETSAVGNKFASISETPLTTAMNELELGVLSAGEHGSFAFTGAANDAFMSAYMDNSFPGSSLDGVAKKRAYMRNKSGSNESRNNALAWFKLRYRIELATSRR